MLEIKCLPSSPLPAMVVQATGSSNPEIEFDGSIDNRVKSEDLLDTVRVFGVSPHADSGVHVMRQLGTSKEEGVGLGAVAQNDLCKDAPFDDQIEVLPLQLFLNAEDLIEDAGFFRIGLLKSEGQDLHLGPGDFGIFRKPTGGAFHLDADLFMKGLLIGMVEPVADPSSNIFNNADKLNTVAFLSQTRCILYIGHWSERGSRRWR